jgi:hypothetical protein
MYLQRVDEVACQRHLVIGLERILSTGKRIARTLQLRHSGDLFGYRPGCEVLPI